MQVHNRNLNNENKEVIIQNLENTLEGRHIESDEELLHKSDASNLSEHNKQYTFLLEAYIKDFQHNSENKRKNKEEMYKISKNLLIFVPVFTAAFLFITLILLAFDIINVIESLPGLITALISLVGTFMVIPKMITKYLFNKKEEDHLAEIISKIQEYDRNIRGDL